jgi:hypothetical protein
VEFFILSEPDVKLADILKLSRKALLLNEQGHEHSW